VVLALDVGEARIGVARGVVGEALVFGRGVITRTRHAADLAAVRRTAATEGAALVVVGLPLRAQGDDSLQTERVRSFAAALRKCGVVVALQDERFTTALAGRALAAGTLRRKQRAEKGRLDELAAIAIAETYLARVQGGA
jgi:putative holliday junction resolvase